VENDDLVFSDETPRSTIAGMVRRGDLVQKKSYDDAGSTSPVTSSPTPPSPTALRPVPVPSTASSSSPMTDETETSTSPAFA
jgi:hypothetical protein